MQDLEPEVKIGKKPNQSDNYNQMVMVYTIFLAWFGN